MTLRTLPDITALRKQNGILLTKPAAIGDRIDALQKNDVLRELEQYALEAPEKSFNDIVVEYGNVIDYIEEVMQFRSELTDVVKQCNNLLHILDEAEVGAICELSALGSILKNKDISICSLAQSLKNTQQEIAKTRQELEEKICEIKAQERLLEEKKREVKNLEDQETIQELGDSQPCESKKENKKVLNKPNPEYKALMIMEYGRNKALQMLRNEGYDV